MRYDCFLWQESFYAVLLAVAFEIAWLSRGRISIAMGVYPKERIGVTC